MIRLDGRSGTYLARDRGGLANLLAGAGSPSASSDELVDLFKTIPFDELVGLYVAGEWWDREGEPGVRAFHQLVRDGTMPYPVVDCREDGIGCLLLPDTHTYTSEVPDAMAAFRTLMASVFSRSPKLYAQRAFPACCKSACCCVGVGWISTFRASLMAVGASARLVLGIASSGSGRRRRPRREMTASYGSLVSYTT